ncbi:hypothetical protein ACVWWO_006457 [Bradyrhizobium sp. F1.13.1]
MQHEDYPALFLAADDTSNNNQSFFLWLIRGEYLTLVLAAILSMSFLHGVGYHLIYAGVFFIGLAILLTRALSKPEQIWYGCRALAESVKTLTWRYMMHATPFEGGGVGGEQQARSEFRNQLHAVFDANREVAKKITSVWSTKEQISTAMDRVRAMNRADRMNYYLSKRVDDQRGWYARKAGINKRNAFVWVCISCAAYILAGGMTLSRIAWPDWPYWPIEPLIVIAASIVGWMQIKKFNELTAAYTVAAHEIGLIRPMAQDADNDKKFSTFVNDAEQAFSREHTLWIARQSD